MILHLRFGNKEAECGMGWPKLAKGEEASLKKILSEENVDIFFFAAGDHSLRMFSKRTNIECKGVMDRLLKCISRVCPCVHQRKIGCSCTITWPSHNAAVIRQFLAKEGNSAPHYSQDLAPADSVYFQN